MDRALEELTEAEAIFYVLATNVDASTANRPKVNYNRNLRSFFRAYLSVDEEASPVCMRGEASIVSLIHDNR